MAARKKRSTGPTPVEAITHGEKRINIPTADAQDFVDESTRQPVRLAYARDTTLDPQLVWRGKDDQDSTDLVVDAPPIYIQEKIVPRVLVENLRRTAVRPEDEPELALFESFDGLQGLEPIEFYKHAANWSNRLILGDSLQVMASLTERENLRGQVQMIYMDPPYGINFGSNWQVSTRSRNVKDRVEDSAREVEQIKAFRDTWEMGVHSYLAYMRDRLTVARDLLTESGSIFVQIGDENLHLVRCLMDEVFGPENFVAQISFRTKIPLRTTLVPKVYDHVLWFARQKESVRFRRLFRGRQLGADTQFGWIEEPNGNRRRLTPSELANPDSVEGRIFRLTDLVSAGRTESCVFRFSMGDKSFYPSGGKSWKTNPRGIEKLLAAERIMAPAKTPAYVFYADDYPVMELDNVWSDTQGATDRSYVVQTSTKVIERCLLMSTDPGDLVLDPTCGSGTTALVAEQWGRRWITVDTSRVALAVARHRIMGAVFPHYVLADSPEGREKEYELSGHTPITSQTEHDVRKGFVYRRVPHVTLGSITNNPEIIEGMSRSSMEEAIARHAESELLYDQPFVNSKKVRVAGPLTVESLSPHRTFGSADGSSASEAAGEEESSATFEQMLLENLKRSGVQNGRKAERFEFADVALLPGRHLCARATPSGGFADHSVAISIGPRYGTVGADWIKAAAREAMRGSGHDVLLVLGFAFDPRALETVEEFQSGGEGFEVQAEHQAGGIRVLLVRMNADLAMGESLLKKTKAANLFTVFGEPDIAAPEWTDEGWVVSIRGFDVYNPLTGEVRAGTEDEIAMWMIDTDYNEESFFVRHAYFLGSDPYGKLKKALKADINQDAWETLNSATSRPFAQPSTGKIAIKVINHYGDELLSVIELQSPTG